VSVVDCIAALRDKSLVHAAPDGRLALYTSIRDYAVERLESRGSDVAHAVRARHAAHYARTMRGFNEARTFQGAEPDASPP
jgi:predicted ATPase